VELHTRKDGDDDFDEWFAVQKGSPQATNPPPLSGNRVRPDETSHLITKADVELFRRAVCRKLKSFQLMLEKDIDAQYFKSEKDLKHVKEAASDNIDALYCKAREKLDPLQKEQQRDRIITQHDMSGVCCCQSRQSSGLISECDWSTRAQTEVSHARETNLCALQPGMNLEPYRQVVHNFRSGKDDEVQANDIMQLVDKCIADADWREYMGMNKNELGKEDEEEESGPKDWKKKCQKPDPGVEFLLKDMKKEEEEYLKGNTWRGITPEEM